MNEESETRPRLELRNVRVAYPSLPVLGGVSLAAGRAEFVSIIGPSGCGKSTLFNVVAGLEDPTAGEVLFDGDCPVSRLGLVGYMPQKDLLLPWRTVLDNVVLGLEVRGVNREAARQAALARFPHFGLAGFERSRPSELSGGMRQRAAFLRTLLLGRDVLLLDEPFGALDALTRAEMQEWLIRVWEEERPTVVFVTHDVDEAVLLSDRIYVLSERPAVVRREVVVDLPRPRRYDLETTPAFGEMKAKVLAALHGGTG
jgi:ABC-type nitrate/sulfonate/bicarbonate transport system ATPase subunit